MSDKTRKNPLVKALAAIYDFFAGDHIILAGVAAAFVVGALLVHTLHGPMAIDLIVFVALIVGGLVLTLRREAAGREKPRQ